MKMQLPEAFEKRMQQMLGDEYEDFLKSYEDPRQFGLRINPMKTTADELIRSGDFHLQRIPWCSQGYYYEEQDLPARHPYYTAGLYYLQEPSAMAPASILPVHPGEKVLDLCAAPGGKATALGAALNGEGLLVANDISNSRAKALLKNIEMFGISNALVTNEIPGNLTKYFTGFFDKILVDAPCSGEGMFRKDPDVIKTWDEERPEFFAKLQKDILKNAAAMLKPGGMLLYSTCTFAPIENEGSISWILQEEPDLELVDLPEKYGFSHGNPQWGDGNPQLKKCARIWPHRMKGEGHFLAMMKKSEQAAMHKIKMARNNGPDKKTKAVLENFFKDCRKMPDWTRVEIRGEKVYRIPELPEKIKGIHFLRNGLYMGELKKDRFEPSQQLAMTLKKDDYKGYICLKADDERIGRYLKGETILAGPDETSIDKGWILVCVDGYGLGWGKLVNGVIKNKYWSGWRKN